MILQLSWYFTPGVTRDSCPHRVGQRPVEHTVGHCLGCTFHWLPRENKFPPSLLGNSSSLSNWQREEFISIVSNILKESVCHVDFSGTVSVIKQCSRWKEKVHLIWIFPPSSLTYKAQQFRPETPLSAEPFWVTKADTETGVGMSLEILWKFISLGFSLVFVEDVGQKMFVPLGKFLFSKEAGFFFGIFYMYPPLPAGCYFG